MNTLKKTWKLSRGAAAIIRRRKRNGETLKAIADDFNVTTSAIWWIISGRTYGRKRRAA